MPMPQSGLGNGLIITSDTTLCEWPGTFLHACMQSTCAQEGLDKHKIKTYLHTHASVFVFTHMNEAS